jgi:DNA-binding GntR family transcriptional regulator
MGAPGVVRDEPPAAVTVHDRLRDAILSGELAAGKVMSQVELARQFNVSRTPLREAIRMLQREGLIEGEAKRRVRVTPISIEDLEQLYALRIVNESLGVRLTVPELTAEDDAFLEHTVDEMNRYSFETEFPLKDHWHRMFHARLVVHAGPRLVGFLQDLRDHAGRYRRMYVQSHDQAWTIAVLEHDAILASARERDAQRAAVLTARHLARTALAIIGSVAPEYEPRAVRIALRSVLDPAPLEASFLAELEATTK